MCDNLIANMKALFLSSFPLVISDGSIGVLAPIFLPLPMIYAALSSPYLSNGDLSHTFGSNWFINIVKASPSFKSFPKFSNFFP